MSGFRMVLGRFFCVGVILLSAACSGSSGGLSTSSSSGSGGDSSGDTLASDAGSASESVQINLRATSSVTANLVRDTVTIPSAYDDYCDPESGSETDRCHLTPENYDLGILAIYLVDCQDASDVSVTCDSPDYDHVGSRMELYNGDQEDTRIDADGVRFDEELTAIVSDTTYGGLQIVTAYIQQQFPESSVDAAEDDKVVAALQGTTYRICTSPESEVDAVTMATRCGAADAQMGDYLVDMDGDGAFGYMVIANDGVTTSISETATRPSGYDATDPVFAARMVAFLDPDLEYTSVDFYGTEGYFAPLFPFTATQALTSENDYQLSVAFSLDDSFEWHDGADSGIPDTSICVDALSDQTCSPDKDPSTVGVYDPFYDDEFLPRLPSVAIEVDELHERLYVATGEYSISDTWDAVMRFEGAEDINSDVDGTVTPDAELPVKQMTSAGGLTQNFEHGVYLSDERDTLFLSMLFTDSDYPGIDTECSVYLDPATTPIECQTSERNGSIAIIDGISSVASGAVTLNRHIEGGNTQLQQPHGVWVDETREMIYAANTFGSSILVFNDAFDSTTDGDIAPDRVITSPGMDAPVFVFINEEEDRMFVANMGGSGPAIYIFNNASGLNGAVSPDTRIIDDTPFDASDTDTTRLTMGNNQTTHNVLYDTAHDQIIVAHHTNEVIIYDVSSWDLDTGMGDIEPDAADVRYLQINETASDENGWSAYGIFYLPTKDRLYVSCGYSAGGPPSGSPPSEIKVFDDVSDPAFSGMMTPERTIQWSSGATYYPPQGLWVTEYE